MKFERKKFCGFSRAGESIFQFAISSFESSRPSQPVTQLEIVQLRICDMSANSGFLTILVPSLVSRFSQSQGEAGSLRQILEIFPFLRDAGRSRARSLLPGVGRSRSIERRRLYPSRGSLQLLNSENLAGPGSLPHTFPPARFG
jgi:hypothetical protein